MSKQIPLTQGKFAIVDDEDFEWLNEHKWYAARNERNWYAHRGENRNGKVTIFRMHREILSLTHGDTRESDHKNRNGLDNRKSNLRIATHAQNQHNREGLKDCSSKYKGVYWRKDRNRWVAIIRQNGKVKKIGSFRDEVDAAKTYDRKAKQVHGEFAFTNF